MKFPEILVNFKNIMGELVEYIEGFQGGGNSYAPSEMIMDIVGNFPENGDNSYWDEVKPPKLPFVLFGCLQALGMFFTGGQCL